MTDIPFKGMTGSSSLDLTRIGGVPLSQIRLDIQCSPLLCWDSRDSCLLNSKSQSEFAVQKHQLEALSA